MARAAGIPRQLDRTNNRYICTLSQSLGTLMLARILEMHDGLLDTISAADLDLKDTTYDPLPLGSIDSN